MRPLQISADTALKLSKALGIPLEHLMHTPQHILLQKLSQLAQEETAAQAEAQSQETQATERKDEQAAISESSEDSKS
ncbi:YycC family protein [Paenibacillus sp. 481]|uniref:YycC family protein n=1 Tax=Paenibacillus sp. 481 TaxID=2835869 RepID=UPI001E43DFC3|nr:YycC family protein [Paenibacillus sp. 481]UHA74652.1 YycC family protein [Paenibacillus sp. 481]